MTFTLRWLAGLAALSSGIGMLLVLAASAPTTQPHPGGFGNLGPNFLLPIAVWICPLPVAAVSGVALVAAARARHLAAVVAFLLLALVRVGIVCVLYLGSATGWTSWLLQHISPDPGDLLRHPRPILALYALDLLDLLIPLVVGVYILTSAHRRPAVMTTYGLLVIAASAGLLLLCAG
jgi:hypothetical protein